MRPNSIFSFYRKSYIYFRRNLEFKVLVYFSNICVGMLVRSVLDIFCVELQEAFNGVYMRYRAPSAPTEGYRVFS